MGHQNHDASHPVDWTTEGSGIIEEAASSVDFTPERTDAQLAAAACEGDESAFETLFVRHRRRVGIIAGRFFQQKEEIEDVVQECFAKAYFALKDFSHDREGSLQSWLSTIAFNTCYDELRRRRRKPEGSIGELSDREAQTISALRAAASEESIESVAISRDLANKLLSRLSAEDRLVLVLLDVEGLSVAEIGKVMSWYAARVKIRVFRARNQLRRILQKFL